MAGDVAQAAATRLAAMNTAVAHDRQAFWRGLWTDFPYSDAVIIYVSLDVDEVLPSPVELERWEASGRVLRPRR